MFILASASPRRKQLLKEIIHDFVTVVPMGDENIYRSALANKDLPFEESRYKAYQIKSVYPHEEVLACDTMVLLKNEALGKPKDAQEAKEMLRKEAGQKQVVLSSYTYLGERKEISRTVKSIVIFRSLSDEQIEEYIQKFEPFDKAGAYGIQDNYPLIERIEGSYANVMGLPIEDIAYHVLKKKIPPYSLKSFS